MWKNIRDFFMEPEFGILDTVILFQIILLMMSVSMWFVLVGIPLSYLFGALKRYIGYKVIIESKDF